MSRDPFDSKGIAEAREEQNRARAMKKTRAEEAIEFVMSSENGRMAMEVILDLTRVFQPTFNTNALQMAHNEGRRAVGLELMSLIDPEQYQLLLREIYERRTDSHRR